MEWTAKPISTAKSAAVYSEIAGRHKRAVWDGVQSVPADGGSVVVVDTTFPRASCTKG